MQHARSLVVAIVLLGLVAGARAQWRIHADWCAFQDHGSSHHAWHRSCQKADQFDSVLACQRDSGTSSGINEVTAAGRPAVNAYM